MCIELPFSGFFGRVILHLNSKICKQHHKKSKYFEKGVKNVAKKNEKQYNVMYGYEN